MMKKFLSPRTKLINSFRSNLGADYTKVYINNPSEDILQLKLKAYVNSLLSLIHDKGDITVVASNNVYSIFNRTTLLNSYNYKTVRTIANENQLGLTLFIEWGYLISLVEKSNIEQLLIAL